MLSIVIPVFNEAENLGLVIEGIKVTVPGDLEIIVVDDCSLDNSAAIARKYQVKLLEQPFRMGNGAAIKRGIREAKGDILVLMDGDGQHEPSDIRRLLEHIQSFDMVVGSRLKAGYSGFSRWLANRIYNWLASYVTYFKVEDLTSGFRVIKRELALKFLYLLPNGFSYPTTLTLALLKTGRSIKYISITALRRAGRSKIKPVSDGINFFLIIVKIATFFSPLKIFLPASIFFFILGAGYYAYTYLNFHRFTNMSTLLITTSVIIFMLGLISEQISQLRLDRTENS